MPDGANSRDGSLSAARLAPLTTTIVEQVVAYARYYLEKRDPRVVLFAIVFVLVSTVPALFIDIARLPAKAYELWTVQDGTTPNRPADG